MDVAPGAQGCALGEEPKQRLPLDGSKPILRISWMRAEIAARLAKKYELTETPMPLLIWLSAFSYWRRVNTEMTRATLQFLDDVERPGSSRSRNALVLGEPARQFAGHEDVRSRTGDLRG